MTLWRFCLISQGQPFPTDSLERMFPRHCRSCVLLQDLWTYVLFLSTWHGHGFVMRSINIFDEFSLLFLIRPMAIILPSHVMMHARFCWQTEAGALDCWDRDEGRDVLALSNHQHARPAWWHQGSFHCTVLACEVSSPYPVAQYEYREGKHWWFEDQVPCFAQQLPADRPNWIGLFQRQGQRGRCPRFCKCARQEAAEDVAWVDMYKAWFDPHRSISWRGECENLMWLHTCHQLCIHHVWFLM